MTLVRTSFFGVISSSCSYASSALAKSLFARGADFTATLVFRIASTNLVVELGLVLWLLIGWQFALAEFIGGAVMIMLLGLIVPRVIPESWIRDARERLEAEDDRTVDASATIETVLDLRAPNTGDVDRTGLARPPHAHTVLAPTSGFLVRVDEHELLRLAADHDASVVLDRSPGCRNPDRLGVGLRPDAGRGRRTASGRRDRCGRHHRLRANGGPGRRIRVAAADRRHQ